MQMRPVTFAIFISCVSANCLAADIVSARIVEGSSPSAIGKHQKALHRLVSGESFVDDVPRPEENTIDCGDGTTIVWTKKRKGRSLVADDSLKSTVVAHFSSLSRITGSGSVELKGEDNFLYIAVEHAGRVCAGYATSGKVEFKSLSSSAVDIRINAEVKKVDLTGEKSCSSGRLDLAFVVDESTLSDKRERRLQCKNEVLKPIE